MSTTNKASFDVFWNFKQQVFLGHNLANKSNRSLLRRCHVYVDNNDTNDSGDTKWRQFDLFGLWLSFRRWVAIGQTSWKYPCRCQYPALNLDTRIQPLTWILRQRHTDITWCGTNSRQIRRPTDQFGVYLMISVTWWIGEYSTLMDGECSQAVSLFSNTMSLLSLSAASLQLPDAYFCEISLLHMWMGFW